MRSWHPNEIARTLLFAALIAFCALVGDATDCYVATAFVLVLAIVIQFLGPLSFLRLQMAWSAGFLYTVCREGYFDRVNLIARLGPSGFDTTTRYVCISNAACLLVWTISFRESRFPTVAPVAAPTRTRTWPLAVLYVSVLAILLPAALATFSTGRLATLESGSELAVRSLGDVAIEALLSAVSIFLPTLVTFHVDRVLKRPAALAWGLCLPLFVVQYMDGTRYHLLFSVTGASVVLLAKQRITTRTLAALAALAAVLLVLSGSMAGFREVGFQSEHVGDIGDTPGFHYEGVILYLGYLIEYCRFHGHLMGASTGGVLLFWIPRVIWASKPTLVGYWLPREISSHFSAGYSAAATFSADPVADFGTFGGIALCAVLGLLFGRLESWAAKVLSTRNNAWLTVVAPLYGGAFFAIRSLDTTFITFCGFAVLSVAYQRFMLRAPTPPAAKLVTSSANRRTQASVSNRAL